MRKNFGKFLWGIVILSIGVILLGNVLDFWYLDLFDLLFDGWWSLFIIIPCVVSMIQGGVNLGNFIGAFIGVFFLLSQLDILPFYANRIFIPAIVIIVGLSIIFKGLFSKKNNKTDKNDKTFAMSNDDEQNSTSKNQALLLDKTDSTDSTFNTDKTFTAQTDEEQSNTDDVQSNTDSKQSNYDGNKLPKNFVGIIIIVFGIILLGNPMNSSFGRLFSNTWWTIFIIAPCLFWIIKRGVNFFNVIGLLVAAFLILLNVNNIYFSRFSIGQIFIPIVFIVIGLLVLFNTAAFKNKRKSATTSNGENQNKSTTTPNGEKQSHTAIFGSDEAIYDEQDFLGCTFTAVFGEAKLDLRNSIISDDVVINAITIFGRGTIKLPPNARGKLSTNPMFGDVDNQSTNQVADDAPTVYINSTCFFGRLEII